MIDKAVQSDFSGAEAAAMEETKFSETMRTMRLMKASDPNFSAEKFVNPAEFSDDQRKAVEKEFGKRKKWMDNPLFYGYQENDNDGF